MLERLRPWRGFLLAVVLPTTLVAAYFYGIAAGQYASEARFLVRGRAGASPMALTGGIGDALGAAGFRPVQEEAMAVRDFLRSADAVEAARRQVDLVEVWRRPEADPPARLWHAEPTLEQLTRYYRRMVRAEYDGESGAVSLQVRAFRPEDSRVLAETLLLGSESLVNRLSARQREDTLGTARAELRVAEARVVEAREAVTRFRQTERAVDPAREVAANVEAVSAMEAAITATRAELGEKSAFMRADNPQIRALRNRIESLERQVIEERRRLTEGTAATPQLLAAYERLLLEREFADRQLASATAGLESARVDAARQQLYVSRIVEPRAAESAEYPLAFFVTASVFAVLCVVYGIASLMMAGFREHAA